MRWESFIFVPLCIGPEDDGDDDVCAAGLEDSFICKSDDNTGQDEKKESASNKEGETPFLGQLGREMRASLEPHEATTTCSGI